MGIIDRNSITEDFLALGGRILAAEESQRRVPKKKDDEPKDAGKSDNGEGPSEAPGKETANKSAKRRKPVETEREDEAPKEKKPKTGKTTKTPQKKPASLRPGKAKAKEPEVEISMQHPETPEKPSGKKGKEVAPKPKTAVPKPKVTKSKPKHKAKPGKPKVHKGLARLSGDEKEALLKTIAKKPSGKGNAKKNVGKPAADDPQEVVCGYWMKSSNKACTRTFCPSGPTNIHCWQHKKFEPK